MKSIVKGQPGVGHVLVVLCLLVLEVTAHSSVVNGSSPSPQPLQAIDAESAYLAVLGIGDKVSAIQAQAAALTATEQKAPDPATEKKLENLAAQTESYSGQAGAAAAQFPRSARVQRAAASVFLQSGDYEEGLALADRAVGLAEGGGDPGELETALRVRAAGELWAGDFPKAAADAKRALTLKPRDVHALRIYMWAKDRTAAPASATAAASERPLGDILVESSPLDDPRVKLAGRRAEDHLAALKQLDQAMRLLGLNDAGGALQASQRAQALDPSLGDAYMQQALAWAVLKDMAQALVEVTKAIGVWAQQGKTANLPAAYSLRASFQNGLGNPDAAARDADKALSIDPSLASAYFQRGRALQALGRKQTEVLAAYKRAADLSPADYQAAYETAADHLSGAPATGAAAAAAAGAWGGGPWRAVLSVAAYLLAVLLGVAAWLARRGARPGRASWSGPGGPQIGAAGDGERRALDSQYDMVEKIGEGGMGAVYRGWDKALKRPVAIKRLRPELQGNPRERERFIKEAEMVASLRHPHIVEIYTILRDDDDTHLVFEFIVGRTLHELLNESRGRHLEPKRALEILRQVAEAVDHAHSRRVIHRDLKPANVMIADGGWVKVMDFGIARQVQDSLLTTTNTIVGTPTYMAPEQALGAVVRESDVYALGVSFYEMLTGGLPFKGPDEMHEKLDARFLAPSRLLPGLPPSVDAVLAKALAARAEERYHSCLELHAAAAEALDGRATPARS